MGLNELREKYFWRAVFVEFFATALFIYLVTTVLINLNPTTTGGATIVQISFAIGLAISVFIQVFGPISGAHINPAVTIGVLINGGCSIIKAVFYTLAQLIGAIAGSAITYGLTPEKRRGGLGNLSISPDITETQGLFVELILTMVLVFTVLASTSSDHNRKDFGYANGLAIGISITVAHLVGIPYTGSGINPARAFGPAVVANQWEEYHWIYWVGPYIGGALAAVMYKFIFSWEKKKPAHEIPATNGNDHGTFTVTTQ